MIRVRPGSDLFTLFQRVCTQGRRKQAWVQHWLREKGQNLGCPLGLAGAFQEPRQVARGPQGHRDPPACSQIMSGLKQPHRTPQGVAWAKLDGMSFPLKILRFCQTSPWRTSVPSSGAGNKARNSVLGEAPGFGMDSAGKAWRSGTSFPTLLEIRGPREHWGAGSGCHPGHSAGREERRLPGAREMGHSLLLRVRKAFVEELAGVLRAGTEQWISPRAWGGS